jgi:hypothetical protein
VKAFEKFVFGPCTLERTWGTRPKPWTWFGEEVCHYVVRPLLVTPHRNLEFLAICVFPVAFRVFPSETAKDGDLVTYASYGFGEEWLHHNS